MIGIVVWLAIERTGSGDRFFEWVHDNPDYEIDSLILAFILMVIGITVAACRRYREMVVASRERDFAEAHVHTLTYHDSMTGLPNRTALTEHLASFEAQPASGLAALIFIDLDRFKGVNDLHGHAVGDGLLRLVAERFQMNLRAGEKVYRLGGDEFAIVIVMGSAEDMPQRSVARSPIMLQLASRHRVRQPG